VLAVAIETLTHLAVGAAAAKPRGESSESGGGSGGGGRHTSPPPRRSLGLARAGALLMRRARSESDDPPLTPQPPPATAGSSPSRSPALSRSPAPPLARRRANSQGVRVHTGPDTAGRVQRLTARVMQAAPNRFSPTHTHLSAAASQ
jgi:pyruvate/2-oxoglutarate dehydrogenase complex dihydrolipoamide acyltransferase (E2) component